MRKIVILTGTRAEYGILKNTLKKIVESSKLKLYIVVTGTHLLEQYGYTIKEIEEDGFEIFAQIPVKEEKNEIIRVPVEMGMLMIKLAQLFDEIQPDVLLLFGDRYEMLAAASVAVGMHIPIAHISGGESTQGAMDEQIRHAITKMAHIHFPGAIQYADNIRKMGEEPWRIYEVGDPGVENIKNIDILSKSLLEKELKISIDRQTLLVTYHPVTLEKKDLEWQINNLIQALKKHEGIKVITYPNSDDGSELIICAWKRYAKENRDVCLVESLGIVRYISLMHYCGAVIGNSSSAIVEAPFLKVPAVNIGNRQKGRLMSDSIISCGNKCDEICEAIKTALSPGFNDIVKRSKSLYGEGNTSETIVQILENINLDESLLKKKLEWSNL